MNWRRRAMWSIFFFGLFALVLRWHGLKFSGPHELKLAEAVLSPALERRVDRLAASRGIDSPRKAIDLALELTSQSLRYGAPAGEHLEFDGVEQAGLSPAYAQLFAAVFNRIADGRELSARARPVLSSARVFGFALPDSTLKQHTWVMVQPGSAVAAESWFVDPTLHDALLGWSIEGNVAGLVPLEQEAQPEPEGYDPEDLVSEFEEAEPGGEGDLDAPGAARAQPRSRPLSRTNSSAGKAKPTTPAVIQKTGG